MTRFFTTVNADASLTALKDTCDCLALGFKLTCNKQVHLCLSKQDLQICRLNAPFNTGPRSSLQVTVSTLDKRNNKLIFKVRLLEMNQRVLLDFRLSKVGFSISQ